MRNNEEHFDLSHTRLDGCFDIRQDDDQALPLNANVTCANLFPHCLFKSVELIVNGKQIISQSTPAYPYKAFFETFFSYTTEEKKGHLRDLVCYSM